VNAVAEEGFPCTRCGLCCRNLHKHSLYEQLDRGDGVCIHFDEASALCSIYEHRPDICRIDLMYDKIFAKETTREVYYQLNLAACRALQDEAARPDIQKQNNGG
jgi:Fe-S-cluster containining protein